MHRDIHFAFQCVLHLKSISIILDIYSQERANVGGEGREGKGSRRNEVSSIEWLYVCVACIANRVVESTHMQALAVIIYGKDAHESRMDKLQSEGSDMKAKQLAPEKKLQDLNTKVDAIAKLDSANRRWSPF